MPSSSTSRSSAVPRPTAHEHDLVGPSVHGRLSHVLSIRTSRADPEAPIVIAHREGLIHALGKAAELEHLVVLQYLYAAFSLKREGREGLAAGAAALVGRWHDELMHIAEQEMLHLALVQNLLTAVGAGPHFGRANFPLPRRAYPTAVQMALLPFGEATLRHFVFLERPEGMDVDDAEGFAALEKANPLPGPGVGSLPSDDEIMPLPMDFQTIGHLYRSIEDGFATLADRVGEERLFIGPARAQATAEHFRWDELVPVSDLASARRAIGTIVEQGEGARGDWRTAHFGRLVAMLDEYLAARAADPAFEPTRPVLAAAVRPPESGAPVAVIGDPFTARCVDLLNATYELLLQILSRYFAHSGETNRQLGTLAWVAVELMEDAVAPLGELVTRLPIGPEHPGRRAGPMFELFYAVDYLLPHREAAWALMEERLREVADLALRCRNACVVPTYLPPLARVADTLRTQADRLAAARRRAVVRDRRA